MATVHEVRRALENYPPELELLLITPDGDAHPAIGVGRTYETDGAMPQAFIIADGAVTPIPKLRLPT